jgi:hypothetical protein
MVAAVLASGMDHAGIEVKNKTGKEVDGTSLSNNPPQVCCERSRVQMLARGDRTAMQSDANSSLHQPANREINREFCLIRPFTAIFVSDQRADSMAYSGIPYVTEQGISKDVSGKILSRNRESASPQ